MAPNKDILILPRLLSRPHHGHLRGLLYHASIFRTTNSYLTDDNKPALKLLFRDVYTIVTHAGILSLLMQLDTQTVYHFVPVFKDSFRREDMECINHSGNDYFESPHPH